MVCKFRAGEEVFHIRYGIGFVFLVLPTHEGIRVGVLWGEGKAALEVWFSGTGKERPHDIYPILLTLNEAKEKGYLQPPPVPIATKPTLFSRVFGYVKGLFK